MKGRFFLAAVLLAAAVFLCGAVQAEIRVSKFPGFDAIPEHFELLADGMPPLPSAKIESDGTIIVTGVKAWGIDQQSMTDWEWTDWGVLDPVSSETYDDKVVIRAKNRKSNEFVNFPIPGTEDSPAEMDLIIGNDFNSYDSTKGAVSVRFRYKADGTEATCETGRTVRIERRDERENLTVRYDESGDFISAGEIRSNPDGYGRLGDYALLRVTDCVTGEQFDEITVTGEVEPDAMQIRMAEEAIPRRLRIQAKERPDFNEGDPALPVLDPLPENALPEVWPAEYPDAFPAFSCEVKDGKTVWTVESLTGWGARVNIPGETYLMRYGNNINYYERSYTLDEVPEDRFRIVSELPYGSVNIPVETEHGPYRMKLSGKVETDSEGNPAPWLQMTLIINEKRYIEVEYFSDGKTVRKKISMMTGDRFITGEYGEDNRLQ